jgi:hypothetical protein
VLLPRFVEFDVLKRVELPRDGVRAAMIPEATRDAAGPRGAAPAHRSLVSRSRGYDRVTS